MTNKIKIQQEEEYKETELGLLPKEWEVVKLGNIADFSKRPRDLDVNTFERLPFISMEMIPIERIYIREHLMKKSSEISSGVYCEKGDILLPKITPCFENGKQGIVEDIPSNFAFATTEVYPIKPKNDLLDKLFLFYFLIRPDIRRAVSEKMQGTTGRRRVPKDAVDNMLIPLPPLSEQKKIAALLSTVQEAKEKTEAVINAAKDLKRSMMKHLFTYGPVPPQESENVPLKETEIGVVPEEWEVVRLGDIGNFQYGYTETASNEEIGPKFLRITDIDLTRSSIDWPNVPYCKIPEEEYSKYELVEGDILIARIGATTGKTCVVKAPPKSVFASYLIRFKVNKNKVDPFFVYYYTTTDKYWNQINASKEGKLKKGVSSSQLKTLKISFPPLSVQQKIASILSAIDQKIEVEESVKKALEDLFKTLLHDLMTAKIRVNNLNLDLDLDFNLNPNPDLLNPNSNANSEVKQ